MDISSLTSINSISGLGKGSAINPTSTLTGMLNTDLNLEKTDQTDGTMFGSIFNTALENIKTTNSYLSDAENQEILFALGETENTHDLTIALQKASTALQYTVAIRDKVLDAYKELMQIQI